MYNPDRPSTKRIVITIAALVAAIAAVVAIGAVLLGTLARPASQFATPPVSALALAKQVPQSQPATVAPATQTVESTKPAAPPVTAPKPVAVARTVPSGLGVVVIDAGHEGSPPPGSEPIGPGSGETKPKVESGTSGVATHVDESQRNLEVALVLRKVLEARGVKVVMVRTSQNVKISNSERAALANRLHAALFLRLHCDSAGSSTHGLLTLRPEKNWYPGIDMVGPSAIAAKLIHKATLATTGAYDRGITPRGDLSGFNWSKVPSVLVEMGLMSNPDEDRKLATTTYQQKLAEGMADGVVAFLKSR